MEAMPIPIKKPKRKNCRPPHWHKPEYDLHAFVVNREAHKVGGKPERLRRWIDRRRSLRHAIRNRADTNNKAFQKRESVRHFNKKWRDKEKKAKQKEEVENSKAKGDIKIEVMEVGLGQHGSDASISSTVPQTSRANVRAIEAPV